MLAVVTQTIGFIISGMGWWRIFQTRSKNSYLVERMSERMLRGLRTASAFTRYRVPAHSIGRLSGPKSLLELTPVERLINPCRFAKPPCRP